MINKTILVGTVFTIAGLVLFYSRKTQASESGAEFNPEFRPYDFSFFTDKPYVNPNTSQGSESMNNPLNIRYNVNNDWIGQTGQRNGFCVFDSPVNCYRAGTKILLSYGRRGVDTVAEIISTYAPTVENPTEKYIQFVVMKTGIGANQKVNKENYVALLKAMTYFEIGKVPYADSIIQDGVRRGLNG